MSLNLQDQKKLAWILSKAAAAPGSLSGWKSAFVADMAGRFKRFGERTKISPKQWTVLDRIHEKAV